MGFGTAAELDISGAVTADTGKTGTFNIEPDYKLELSAPIAASQTISFAPEGNGILEIDDLSNVGADGTQQQEFNATIAGVAVSDLIQINTAELGNYGTIDGYRLAVSGENTLLMPHRQRRYCREFDVGGNGLQRRRHHTRQLYTRNNRRHLGKRLDHSRARTM